MKVIIITALLALAVCQLAEARYVNDASMVCTEQAVDRMKENVLTRVIEIMTRFTAVRESYDACLALPEEQQAECLREFSLTAIAYVENVADEVLASKEEIIVYMLARLEDYYQCRLVTYKDVMTSPRSILCALNLFNDAQQQFAEYVDIITGTFNTVKEEFERCMVIPADDQAECLVTLYGVAQATVASAVELVQVRREEFMHLFNIVLNRYYECRLVHGL